MISCPHHSFLSHAVVSRRGRRGARKGQVQLGTGIVQLVAGARAPALALGRAPFQSNTALNSVQQERGAIQPRKDAAADPRLGPAWSHTPAATLSGCSAAGTGAGALQMEADALSPVGLGLLLLPFLVTLLAALCVRCRELPGKWGALRNWMLGTPLDSHTLPSPYTL